MKTGARTLIEALQREGVDTIFGYPGGSVLPIYDELYDSLTGQVPTGMLGNDAFQESDITGITMPVTKHNYLVKDASDLDRTVQEAFYIARTGRPGPVLVDLPKDVTTSHVKGGGTAPGKVSLRGYQPTYEGHVRQIDKALDLIARAERPLVYAGGGVVHSGASAELLEFAEATAIPVTTTLMGLGAVPGDHPLCLGMLGMHGTQTANYAVTECDLLLAIGVRFDDRVTGKIETFAPNAAIIHIDIDPAEIGKNKSVDVPIVGDVKAVLQALLRRMQKRGDTANWMARLNAWKAQYPLRYRDDNRLRPQYIIRELSDLLKGEGIIASEVGQNQMWAALYYCFRKPRTWLTSGGLGTMGYGFPAAIGAHFARPDLPVVDIAGDGSFQMNIQELGTVAHYQIPVKVVILNNMYLGMVRQWQELFYDRRYAYTELPPVDFVKIANAYGVEGIRVEEKEDVREALETALATDGPFVLDFRIEREENVFPMVPAGAAINEMIGVHQE